MQFFDGEQIIERQTEAEEANFLSPAHRRQTVRSSGERLSTARDEQRMCIDQPCGGGRRVIRKRIGD